MELHEKKRLVDRTSYGVYEEEEPQVRHKSYPVDSPRCRKIVLICLSIGAVLLVLFLAVVIGVVASRRVSANSSGADIRQEICAKNPVLLISLDGFWSGYWTRDAATPFLHSLAASGVRAEYMRSEFPTETFPNHYSIVTGLHPESHGIVNNKFYDSVLRKNFTVVDTKNKPATQRDPEWWLAKPIWVTAAEHSGLKSGAYFWPGSEVEGIHPTYYYKYNNTTPYEDRVKTILNWLDQPKATRPQFMAAYFNEPDHTSHKEGPTNVDLINAALSRVDKTMESLFDGLKQRKVENCVNVIIVSDHGMATYNKSKLVEIKNLLSPEVVMINGVAADIFIPQEADRTHDIKEMYNSLVQYAKSGGKPFRTYMKENIPLRLHSGHFNKQRFGDIYLIGDEGSYITRNSKPTITGMHGYDNILTSMQAIFIGHGPAFRKGYVSEAFANIQLYNLMCGLLGISPSPNNGTVGSLYHMLTPSLLPSLPPTQTFQGTEGVRDSCPYPTDEDTYNMRSFCEECVCWNDNKCADVSNDTINDSNMLLNLTDSQIKEHQKVHLPWGVPSGGEGSGSCLLTQQDFITLYSNTLHIPLWSAFRLTNDQASVSQPSSIGCLRRDPRVAPVNSSNCSDYSTEGEFVPVRLAADLSNSSTDQQLTTDLLSNVVPVMRDFNTSVWLSLNKQLKFWATNYSSINVILGSVLDYNKDGERDNDADYGWWVNDTGGVAIPSHFYAIVVRCINDGGLEPADCDRNRLDALGLLFQHPTEPGDPSPPSKLLRFALTPIRDIERVTGVNFFPNLTPEEKNTLELRLTNELWLTGP